MFAHPLQYATSPGFLWLLLGGATVLLTILPWLTRRPAPAAAVVNLENCNGCGRCVADCPFAAVALVPAANKAGRQVAVFPELCAGCGICAGACPSATPFRSTETLVSGIDLPQLTVNELRRKVGSALAEGSRVLVFRCDCARAAESASDGSSTTFKLPCIGMLPPSFVEYALRQGAGRVVLEGCAAGECAYRLGTELTAARLAGEREPHLRASVPRERVELRP
jgi:ferredoxin